MDEIIAEIFDALVGDALVFTIERARHRRHVRIFKRNFWRRCNAHQLGRIDHDILRRRRFIVGDVESATRIGTCQKT
ncbi:hypothetical protein D3C77_735630 [compost metagenome]